MHPIVFFFSTICMVIAVTPKLKTPSVNNRPLLSCPVNYSPCRCELDSFFGLRVNCDEVSIADIKAVFQQSKVTDLDSIRIIIPQNETSPIPADLLGASRTRKVFIYCSPQPYKLVIDDKAFATSKDLIKEFKIHQCNLKNQPNFRFLKAFKALAKLSMDLSRNFHSFEGIPSQSILNFISISFAEGFDNLADDSKISLPGLRTLDLEKSSLNDVTAARILKILTGSSKVSLEKLNLDNNNLTRIQELMSSFPNLLVKHSSHVSVTSRKNGRPFTCPDYYLPCRCEGRPFIDLQIICNQVLIADIQEMFHQSQGIDFNSIRIMISANETSPIPPDLLGASRTKSVSIYCYPESSYQLVIDDKAFFSSKHVIQEFKIQRCDLKNQQNFKFMEGFNALAELNFDASKNVNSFEGIPSQSKLKSISISFSNGFDNLADGHNISLPELRSLDLEKSSLNDVTAAKVLKILTESSKNSLEELNLNNNNLTRIPELISPFTNLNKWPTSLIVTTTQRTPTSRLSMCLGVDYSPCNCDHAASTIAGLTVVCNIPILEIQALFQRLKAHDIKGLSIFILESKNKTSVRIPANLLGASRTKEVILYCNEESSPLVIDSKAFRSSKNLMQKFHINYCDLRNQQNFRFMMDFLSLTHLVIESSNNFNSFEGFPPQLKSISISESTGFNNLSDISIPLPGLRTLKLNWNYLNDETAVKVLKILTGSSKNSLTALNLNNNNLTRLPEIILSFTNLDNLQTKNKQLTRLDSYLFQPILERTSRLQLYNVIECDCHIAWLIVHNRLLLLTSDVDGKCSNSTSFHHLNPEVLRDCPVFTCPPGLDGNFLNPISKSSYYTCSGGNSSLFECPRGQEFSPANRICV